MWHSRLAARSHLPVTAHRAAVFTVARDLVSRRFASRSVEFVASEQRAGQLAADLLHEFGGTGEPLAFDCEGVRLGRFGRICLLQLGAPGGRFFLLDALRPGVVEAVAPLLESRDVGKVIHDCREDSAALFHQHGVLLRAIFDTQAVHALLEKLAGRVPHQVSGRELLSVFLAVEDPPELVPMKGLMHSDEQLWARRPLSSLLVRYALHGVVHMRRLRRALLASAPAPAPAGASGTIEELAAEASDQAVRYCFLNEGFSSAASMAKIGTRLWAMLAARTPSGLVFKLNAGRVGQATTPSAMARFDEVQLGDLVFCCVSGVSIDGAYIYLDRYDHDWDYFDYQLRALPPREPEDNLNLEGLLGGYRREHRHQTAIHNPGSWDDLEDNIDPLLVRGLPGAFDGDSAAGRLDQWDAEAEDVGPYAAQFDD